MSKYSSDLGAVSVPSDSRSKTYVGPAELVDTFKFPSGSWVRLRLIGGVMHVTNYWAATLKKDKKHIGRFPIGCCSWNPETNSQDPNVPDPWRDFVAEQYDAGIPRTEHIVNFASGYYINAIVRKLQEEEPRNKPELSEEEAQSGYKTKDSDAWTPVRVVCLPVSVLDQIQKLKPLNVVRVKSKTGAIQNKAFDLNHPKYGADIMIQYDEAKAGASKYSVNKCDGRSPLTEEEMKYLTYDLDKLYVEYDPNEMQKAFDSWKRRNAGLIQKMMGKSTTASSVDDDEDDEDTLAPVKKAVSSKKTASKPKEVVSSSFDDEDDEDFDAKPAKKQKEEAPWEDEEEQPKPSKKSSDDFDEDFEEDDAKPAKKSSEDEFDDDFEDDENF